MSRSFIISIFILFALTCCSLQVSEIHDDLTIFHEKNRLFNEEEIFQWETDCYQIENPLLVKFCERTGFRPHMTKFMTTPHNFPKDALIDFPKGCQDGGLLENIYCTFLDIPKEPFEEISACQNLSDKRLVGECLFYRSLHETMDKELDIIDTYEEFSSFCDSIQSRFWNAECHYLIADTLALTQPIDDTTMALIESSCISTDSRYKVLCFDHITYLMDLNSSIKFCSKITSEVNKFQCVKGMTENIIRNDEMDDEKIDNILKEVGLDDDQQIKSILMVRKELIEGTPSFDMCKKYDTYAKNECFNDKLYHYLKSEDGKGADRYLEDCKKLDDNSKEMCIANLGLEITRISGMNIFGSIDYCLENFEDNINNSDLCIRGALYAYSEKYIDDPGPYVKICYELNMTGLTTFEKCLRRLGSRISKNSYYNTTKIIEDCNLLDDGNTETCLEAAYTRINHYLEEIKFYDNIEKLEKEIEKYN